MHTNKNKFTTLILPVLVVLLLAGAGIYFVTHGSFKAPTQQAAVAKDEFTGSWKGGGTTKDGYSWFVIYTFQNGTYDMKTESAFKDNGTYVISQRFEDGSIKMTKTSIPFKKTYDIYNTFADNGKTLNIDGMKLNKQ